MTILKLLLVILFSIIILIPMWLYILLIKKIQNKSNFIEIKKSNLYGYISLSVLFFLWLLIPYLSLMILIDPNSDTKWWELLIFCIVSEIVVSLPFLYPMFISLNWKIFVFDDHIEYNNIFNKKKTFNFSDIELIENNHNIKVVSKSNEEVAGKSKILVKIPKRLKNSTLLLEKYNQFKNS